MLYQGTERQELAAAALETEEFKGYQIFGQNKWLDGRIVCVDFDLEAKRRVLAAEEAEGPAGPQHASSGEVHRSKSYGRLRR